MKHPVFILTLALLMFAPFPAPSVQSRNIDFSLVGIDRTEPGKPFGLFTFRHTIARTLRVHSFGPPKDDVFLPWYVQYQVQTNGQWRTALGLDSYSCVMIGSHPLSSRQTYTFKIALPDITHSAALWRVGISTDKWHTNYWSAPFRLSAFDSAAPETAPRDIVIPARGALE